MTADHPGPAPGGAPPDPLADIGAISATDAAFDHIAAGERVASDDPALRLFAGLARDIRTTPPPVAWRDVTPATPTAVPAIEPLRRRAARAGRRAALAGLGAAAASVLCAVGVAATTGVDPVATVTNGRVRLAPAHTSTPAPGLRGGVRPASPTSPTSPASPTALPKPTPTDAPRTPATHDHPKPGRTHGTHGNGHHHAYARFRHHEGHPEHHGVRGNGSHTYGTPPPRTPGRSTPPATPSDPAASPSAGSGHAPACGASCGEPGHGHSDQRRRHGR